MRAKHRAATGYGFTLYQALKPPDNSFGLSHSWPKTVENKPALFHGLCAGSAFRSAGSRVLLAPAGELLKPSAMLLACSDGSLAHTKQPLGSSEVSLIIFKRFLKASEHFSPSDKLSFCAAEERFSYFECILGSAD